MAIIKTNNKKIYLYLAIVLTIAAIVYLAAFIINAYNTFHEYSDLGYLAYNLYFNSHYPQIAHGLQYMVIGNHICPDLLLVIPFFSIFPSSLTILLIELITVYASGILIFYITRDLTKNSQMALVLCIAFLIFPGTIGQVIFDAHIEFTITLFFLLTFYAYMKSRPYLFAASMLLLLGSSESVPILSLSLGFALLLYEYKYNLHYNQFAIILIISSLVAIGIYSYMTTTLVNSYSTSYNGLDIAEFSVGSGLQNNLGISLNTFLHNPITTILGDISIYLPGYLPYIIYSCLLILFGFGIAILFSPDIALIMCLPWFAGIIIFQDPNFVLPFSQYYSFLIAPLICASIIGFIISQRKQKSFRININILIYSTIIGALLLSILSPIIYLYVLSPSSNFHSVNLNGVKELLFFYSTPSQINAYNQLNSIIKLVPSNTSVLTEYFIMPHVIQEKNLDYLPKRAISPQYILIDFNENISVNSCKLGFENCTQFKDIINNGNYSLYASNGTAKLYKKIN